jgi:hypothetical protein
MPVLAALVLLASLAPAQTPPPAASSAPAPAASTGPATGPAAVLIKNSKTRLQADDVQGALRDAEAAVAAGGGADAFAQRAEAKLASGRPIAEAVDDYEQAAKLDGRYAPQYAGLVDQMNTGLHPNARPKSREAGALLSTRVLMGMTVGGLILVVVGFLVPRRRKPGEPPQDY